MPLDHLGQTNKGSRGGFSIFFFFEIPIVFLKEIRISFAQKWHNWICKWVKTVIW